MELTANELRIGNLFDHFEDGVLPIEEIKKDSDGFDGYYAVFRNNSIKCRIDYLDPIPLTEEWLLKFGFEINDDLGDEIYYQIPEEKNGYGICFDHNDITFYKYYGNGAENVHTLIYDEKHLQSVHQLQNIYFSLTNTELKLIK